MIEKNKNMYDLSDRPNQMVFCSCGEILTVWLNVNGEGKVRCKCNCEVTVERCRRNRKIMIYPDNTKCKTHKILAAEPNTQAV